MSQFSFEYPFLLGIVLLFIICSIWCKERSRAIFFPHVKTLMVKSAGKSSWLVWLKWVGITAAIVALASPVLTKSYSNSKKEGRDIVLIIDSSDSMRQRGFDPSDPWRNKFDVVKEVVGDFIEKRENDRIGKIISLWFGISLLLVLIYPGRQTADLIWVVVPLWAGAVKELVKIVQTVEFSWVTNTMSGMVAVLFVLNWLTFIGMIFQQENQRAILLQWGLIAASLALGLLATTIVASEWGWPTAKKGLVVGLSGVLGIYLLSALAQGAYLRIGDPHSLWTEGSGSGQIDLLLDTIAEVSVAETGRQDSIQGTVINGNSSLKWALRDLKEFEFYDGFNPGTTTPVLITNEIDNIQVPLTIYRGQDFVITTKSTGSAVFPDDWISWIAFRDGPIETEDIILWVRHDILPGGENSSGEN